MAVYFLDSSALVKRYRHEAGSERVSALMNEADQLVIARLTQVEVAAALVRRGRATSVVSKDLDSALAALDVDIKNSFDVMELGLSTIERAMELTQRHALRAADAIQLACALIARMDPASQKIVLISSDQELNDAASAEGLSVLDPTV